LGDKFPTYGSRRLAAQIRRDPYKLIVNRKRVQWIMQELGIKKSTSMSMLICQMQSGRSDVSSMISI
jgi:hypothetical protein